MTGWPVRRLVALYPRAWRKRYGGEVADLADELISEGRTTRLRAGLDLVSGAAIEQGRALIRSPAAGIGGAAAITAAAGIGLAVARVRDGGAVGRPYFETAPAGTLLLVAMLGWILVEFVKFLGCRKRGNGGRQPSRARTRLLGGLGGLRELLPLHASVHRGAGYASLVCTAAYDPRGPGSRCSSGPAMTTW